MRNRTIELGAAAVMLLLCVAPCGGQDKSRSVLSGRKPQVARAGKPDGTRSSDSPVLHKRNPRYRICPGDVLDLTFPFTPEFNQTPAVQPDGFITLRGVGDLRVEGLSTPEVVRAVQAAYANILHDPVVTVDLKNFEQPYFVVGGEVGHTGKFEFRRDTTVSEAIALAGGFKETSKHSQVLLFRRVSDDWAEVKVVNLKKMLRSKDLSEDPHLQPGDMLYVPKNLISRIKPYIPIPTLSTYFPLPAL
jgi:polysaccharide export outer membrane protein